MSIFRSVCRVALLASIGMSVSFAQTTTARLAGAVTDTSGAALSKATLTITDENTSTQRVVETADDGTYVVVSLPPATYDEKVERSGFAPVQVKNLIVGVGQTVTQNFSVSVSDNETSIG